MANCWQCGVYRGENVPGQICERCAFANLRQAFGGKTPKEWASPQKIWGNVLIGTGSYGVLLGCAGDFGSGLINVVFLFLGFAVVVAGLKLRNV
jgi:hypothetical protein